MKKGKREQRKISGRKKKTEGFGGTEAKREKNGRRGRAEEFEECCRCMEIYK